MYRLTFILLLYLCIQSGTDKSVLYSQPAFYSNSHDFDKTLQEPYERRRFYVDGIPNLNVFNISGNIEVVHNPEIDHVLVELYVNRGFTLWGNKKNIDNYRILFTQRGDQINATVENKRRDRSWTRDDLGFTFLIQTPKKLGSNLRTMNGGILLEGVHGSHIVHTNSGNITLRDVEGQLQANSAGGGIVVTGSTGLFNIRTVSGNINFEHSRGEIRARTASGSINGFDIEGTLVCATASGNINAQFSDINIGVHAETASGNIDIQVPENRGYQLDVRGARITLDQFQSFNGIQRNTSVRGRTGDGDVIIQLTTVSGNVVIKKNQLTP
jgi:DUF4097 and DUF4098 domain-containing protein YvlB